MQEIITGICIGIQIMCIWILFRNNWTHYALRLISDRIGARLYNDNITKEELKEIGTHQVRLTRLSYSFLMYDIFSSKSMMIYKVERHVYDDIPYKWGWRK